MDYSDSIFFYEPEYYFLSNFSSFAIEWKDSIYMTAEHAYQAEKFEDSALKEKIRNARSAHDALMIAKEHKDLYRKDWDMAKVKVMKEILRAKADQHPCVREALQKSGAREIIENSPADDFWGWGENKNGANQLGKLWMEIREEIKLGDL